VLGEHRPHVAGSDVGHDSTLADVVEVLGDQVDQVVTGPAELVWCHEARPYPPGRTVGSVGPVACGPSALSGDASRAHADLMSGFTYSVVSSSLHEPATIGRILAPVVMRLDELGGRRATEADLELHTPHVIVVGTGGTERAILDMVERRRAHATWEPVVLVAHPRHNSLPAALEALARIRRDGVPGRILQTDEPGEPTTTITDLLAIHHFQHARLGLVGAPSEWLVASVPDRGALRTRWGLELVDVPVEEALAHHRDAPDVAVQAVAVKFTRRGEPAHDTIVAAAMHPTLEKVVQAHRLDAVAVRCFDFITELKTSGCIALAELNDRGVVAGCEGDVASTVTMMLVRELLGQPSWIANPARIDIAGRELLLAHCTVAPSMVDDLELHTHFESGLGVGLRGHFAAGPVTLVRLGGEALDRAWFAEAEIAGSGSDADLCRTQVVLRGVERIDELVDDPLGNHLVMVRGHHRRRLERWWRLAFGSPASVARAG
jgi:L-fucose isomerase-like protein